MHSHTSDTSLTTRPPRWLVAAVIVLVAQSLVSVGLDSQPSNLSRAAVGILLIGLLLWGSRIGWVVVLLGTLYQIGSSVSSTEWRLITGTAIALCLFAPSSLRYVWVTSVGQRSGWMGQRALELYLTIRTSTYAITHRLVGWDDGENNRGTPLRQRSYRVGLWRFGITCLVLLFLGGVTVNWQESAGGDSFLLTIIENVIWICYVFAQLVFIALLVLAMWGILARHKPQRQ